MVLSNVEIKNRQPRPLYPVPWLWNNSPIAKDKKRPHLEALTHPNEVLILILKSDLYPYNDGIKQ